MEEKESDKIIILDEDTLIEEGNSSSIYPYDPANESIEMGQDPFTIYEYLRRLKKGKITIHPDFLKRNIWTSDQKSKFIESILLNYPLAPIYLNETKESKYMIIEGLQRTMTLNQFYKGEFTLNGLTAATAYNKSKFKNLPKSLQSRFENTKLTVLVLRPSTPIAVINDLFRRINYSGTQLNRQEIRNCLLTGNATDLLKNLSEDKLFKKATDNGVSTTRMKDQEVVLRYLSFRWFDFENEYEEDLAGSLDKAMKKINQMSKDQLDEMAKDFKRVMKWSYQFWEQTNFRIYNEGNRSSLKIAILESVGKYISSKEDSFLKSNFETIKNNYLTLVANQTYLSAVTSDTAKKKKVLERFGLANEILSQNIVIEEEVVIEENNKLEDSQVIEENTSTIDNTNADENTDAEDNTII